MTNIDQQHGVAAPVVKYRKILMMDYLDYIQTFTELTKQINIYGDYSWDIYERYLHVVYSLRAKLMQYVKNKEKYLLFSSILLNVSYAYYYHYEILEIIRKLGLLNIDGLTKKRTLNLDTYVKEQTGKSSWGIGEFIKRYSKLYFENNMDMHIIISGYEGSGKSGLAISLASYIDNTFMDNLPNRVAFHARDIDKYKKFMDEQSQLVEDGTLDSMRCFVIDEAQNIYNARKAMHGENKNAVEIIRTQRYAKTGVFYCTPNILEIEKPVLDRANILLIVDPSKSVAYGFVRAIMGEKFYYGYLDDFIEELSAYRTGKRKLLPAIPHLLQNKLGTVFEFKGATRLNKRAYSIYEPLKIRGSRKLYKDNKKLKRKEESTLQIQTQKIQASEKDYFEDKGFKIINGGFGRTHDIIEDNAIYLNDFYSYKAVSGATGKKESRLRQFREWERIKKGRYVYVLARDWIHLL